MKNEILTDFSEVYAVPRAVCWNPKTETLIPRAYSATLMAIKANEALRKFKLNLRPASNRSE